jgi:hypothetical protein
MGKNKIALGAYFCLKCCKMIWKDFVQRWRPVDLTRLGIPNRTVYDWRAGNKEPKGWKRAAVEFWIEAKAPVQGADEETPTGKDGKC